MKTINNLINILKSLLPKKIIHPQCTYYRSCNPFTCTQCIIYLKKQYPKWDCHEAPYLREIIDKINDPNQKKIIIRKSRFK